MKALAALIGTGIIILLLSGVMGALNSFRGTEVVAPYVVANGVTSTTITLANSVLDNSLPNISISSSQATDAPIPYSYTSGTKQLVVNGLDVAVSRTLTITYKVLQVDSFVDSASKFMPAFLILGCICIVGAAVYAAFKHGE